MILSILITAAASVNLFLFSAMKNYSRETFLLAILQGIFIIHSAHLIFQLGQPDDYSLLVKSSFNILYLPLIGLIIYGTTFAIPRLIVRIVLALSIVSFAFIYGQLLLIRSMAFISFANLMYHLQIVLVAALAQHILAACDKLKSLSNTVTLSQFRLARTWSFILLTPYAIDLICYAIPSDNFLVPYKPAFSQDAATEIFTLTLMLWSGFRLVQHKKLLESEHGAHSLRKIKDLAF
jgi:hypothetical protein